MRSTRFDDSAPWRNLHNSKNRLSQQNLRELFVRDPYRFQKFSLTAAGILCDYSKHCVDDEVMGQLLELARHAHLEQWREDLFLGKKINHTEQRAVMHMALRNVSGKAMYV